MAGAPTPLLVALALALACGTTGGVDAVVSGGATPVAGARCSARPQLATLAATAQLNTEARTDP